MPTHLGPSVAVTQRVAETSFLLAALGVAPYAPQEVMPVGPAAPAKYLSTRFVYNVLCSPSVISFFPYNSNSISHYLTCALKISLFSFQVHCLQLLQYNQATSRSLYTST